MSLISLSLLLTALTGVDAFRPSGKQYPVNKPYDQKFEDKYSPLKYLAGLGPYNSRIGEGISTDIPAGCEVDQVVLLQRHGERYPDLGPVKSQRAVLDKIARLHPQEFSGDLEFLNTWEYFLDGDEQNAALMIMKGPYSGLADLDIKGSIFFNRYGHLWDGESGVPLFVSGSERVIQSARSWGRGFAGYNYTDIIEINILSEESYSGANSLSPGYCEFNGTTDCKVPAHAASIGHIVFPELDAAAIRLNTEYGLQLTGSDIIYLCQIGSFDVAANGDSPWLNVFTQAEWNAYEYYQSLQFYCTASGAYKPARAFGTNLANATTLALNQGPEGSGLPFILNFMHDSDITAFLGGLDILQPVKEMNTDRVTFGVGFDVSEIVPMGANLVLERLKCHAPGLTNSTNLISTNATLPDSYLNASYGAPEEFNTSYYSPNYSNASGVYGFNITNGTTNGQPTETSYFVRMLLNEAVVPIDFCYQGPGYSCPLDEWTAHVEERLKVDNYTSTCDPAAGNVPAYFDAYWNYNKTTDLDNAEWIYADGTRLS